MRVDPARQRHAASARHPASPRRPPCRCLPMVVSFHHKQKLCRMLAGEVSAALGASQVARVYGCRPGGGRAAAESSCTSHSAIDGDWGWRGRRTDDGLCNDMEDEGGLAPSRRPQASRMGQAPGGRRLRDAAATGESRRL
ncbi:Os05g0175100 [Oryza sativa Japonica Group]|uniref:Os05g0175100 protein n=1 Tax=Oryza sativa subsp. japonica TaxID=39947 RepID=A0A0P0WIH4_ORYSJ|nr:Os05g0175100 [Oryza sativa Japonica Group]